MLSWINYLRALGSNYKIEEIELEKERKKVHEGNRLHNQYTCKKTETGKFLGNLPEFNNRLNHFLK